MKVFWSWQSDRIPKNHHFFVRDALERACELIASEAEIDESERPEVDHDTKGLTGSPDIAASIAAKIDAAAAFVADMTPIAITDPARLRPDVKASDLPVAKHVQNPNVMSELGYAEKTLSLNRIILVANTAHYPGPEALPFDWRHRRGPVTYHLPDNADNPARTATLTALALKLREPLRLILESRSAPASQAAPIVRHEAAEQDPAIWKEVASGARVRAPFEGAKMLNYVLPPGGRLYVRLVPSQWAPQPLALMRDRLRQGDTSLYVTGRVGNSGVNAEGAMSLWGTEREDGGDEFEAHTITQWFQDSGELWAVDFATFGHDGGGLFFAAPRAVSCVDIFLPEALRAITDLGGTGSVDIEISARGLTHTSWPSRWPRDRYLAVKDVATVRASRAEWSALDRRELLRHFWNQVVDAYGLLATKDIPEFERAAGLTPIDG